MQIQYCNNIRLSAVTDWMRFMSLAGLECKMLSWWFNPVCALYWWTLYIIREWNKEKSRCPDLNDFTTHYRAAIVDYLSQSAKTNGQYGNLVLELSQRKGAMDIVERVSMTAALCCGQRTPDPCIWHSVDIAGIVRPRVTMLGILPVQCPQCPAIASGNFTP